jgi:hypothetical protein
VQVQNGINLELGTESLSFGSKPADWKLSFGIYGYTEQHDK